MSYVNENMIWHMYWSVWAQNTTVTIHIACWLSITITVYEYIQVLHDWRVLTKPKYKSQVIWKLCCKASIPFFFS